MDDGDGIGETMRGVAMKRSVLHPVLFPLAMLFLLPAMAAGQGVEWADLTLEEALAQAAETGQIVMIDVWAPHCGSCGDMDEALWSTPEAAEFTEDLIPLKIESTAAEGADLRRRYPVTGLPAVLFIDPDGREIDRIVGYTHNQAFFAEAEPLRDGYDPLPALEEELAANPSSTDRMMPVFERYLYRGRSAEAGSLLVRIVDADPENRRGDAVKALVKMAKYARIVEGDWQGCYEIWQMILDRYPDSSSTSGAVASSFRAAQTLGRVDEWEEWICEKVETQPANARLHYSVAMTGRRYRLRGDCYADAAIRARELGRGGAFLDTLAVELRGSGNE
ncbi:MAG: thioredoxin fold domain-containing protein [Candidatus Eisenbacteria bacterium]|nr:thioredoxin fold domain-containing protein [Candidatus Latescibacterota bacterium]MBD3301841.1 thioredoxin fold domain-containing protein [Candidatus Eisenbacteria bacterium]